MKRRASAPRLIDWTGERCVPWAPDVQVVYEHLHRYLWVRSFVAGKDVLDLGSGEGFGAAILGETAARVHGVDLDATTVEHASLNYGTGAITFAEADATALPADLDDTFDVVVAFEVIEHVQDHDALIEGVRRVLRPGGVLVVSTPNRLLYETVEGGNPFHVHELSDTEFSALLTEHFSSHVVLSQRAAEGSRIDVQDGNRPELAPIRIEREGDGWREVGPSAPHYLLAVATDGELPGEIGGSVLLDHTLQLKRRTEQADAEVAREIHEQARRAEEVAAEAERRVHALQQAAAEAEASRVTAQTERDDALTTAREQAVELIQSRDATIQKELELDATRAELGAQLDGLQRRLAEVDESITWRLFIKVRRRWRGSGGQRRFVARAGSKALHAAQGVNTQLKARRQVAAEAAAPPPPPPPPPTLLSVPSAEHPKVSIVVPVHSGADMTLLCLRAITAATIDGPTYEVLVLDDVADQETKDMLARVEGIRVIENPENLGFLRSVNAGVPHARGEIIVLLNNDTEPQPGWLDVLVNRLESDPRVGAVGGRLIYPNGSLQEAGGVLFADGSAVNYGNGGHPNYSAYRYARPVDYCSAALLALRKDLWDELGGFDELFVPGYYEDTDLCFRIRRDAHQEVWYEPQAIVLHKEGGSHGTDVTQGVKRHQVINQGHFIERWREELAGRPGTASAETAILGADRREGPVVLIADHIVPEPDRDSGSLRMSQIIDEFIRQGARVVFIPGNAAATRDYAPALEAKGVEILDGEVSLAARLSELRPDCRLVVLSRPSVVAQFLPLVRTELPDAEVVFDTVDLHWVREEARGEFETVSPGTVKAFRELELAMVRATDVTAVVSELERETIDREVPGTDILYLPNVHADPGPPPGREGRSGLLFVGGFRHHPNIDAALQLGEAIMPRVRELGLDTRLTIVGPDAPGEVMDLEADDLEVLGWVPEVEPLIDGAIALVAPLRYGAGMKGKVGQALAHGLPVITTAVGAQGFGLVDGVDALLAETPEEFAAAIERLSSDDELWATLSANGRRVIERTCSTGITAAAVARLLGRAAVRTAASASSAVAVADAS